MTILLRMVLTPIGCLKKCDLRGVIMKVNCMCCSENISLNDEAVLDIAYSLYHAGCYSEFCEDLIEWKDFGKYKTLLEKYDSFKN